MCVRVRVYMNINLDLKWGIFTYDLSLKMTFQKKKNDNESDIRKNDMF